MQIEGNLEAMDLPTLIQVIGQSGEAATIKIENALGTGFLFMNGGMLRHAEAKSNGHGHVEEKEALNVMLRWKEGKFKLRKNVEMQEGNMQEPWDFVLMECLRQLDEESADLSTPGSALTEENNLLSHSNSSHEFDFSGSIDNKDIKKMANLENTLNEIMGITGARAAALVDWESGLTLGTIGGGMDIELAAAGNTNVVRAKFGVMKDLGIQGGIEDILITLSDQYHMIRMMDSNPNLFIYLALDRSTANLGMARHQLSKLEKELSI